MGLGPSPCKRTPRIAAKPLCGLLILFSLGAVWTPALAGSTPADTPAAAVFLGLMQAETDAEIDAEIDAGETSTTNADTTRTDSTRTDDAYRARTDRPGDIRPIAMDEVVVTATKTMTTHGQQAVPATVIPTVEMEEQGAARLSDVLANQPGLTLNYDHGTGLQIQGLGSDYTMILMDGQPLIGRTAGTLDLERLSVRNIERVEIVRGPSSSLYGSEALAGVVNLVTRQPGDGLATSVRTRYGTHQTSDVAAHVDYGGSVDVALSLQRYASGGYDLVPSSIAPTVPTFADHTGRATLSADLTSSTELSLRGRGTFRAQDQPTSVPDRTEPVDESTTRADWSLTPEVTHTLRPGLSITATAYASGFHTRTDLQQAGGATYDTQRYDQSFTQATAEVGYVAGERHFITAGAGIVRESVNADRVTGERTGGFAFLQDEWQVTDRLMLTPSARLDAHSDYATRISPKLASLFEVGDNLRVRASIGSGYKAPAFRQLYLSYTNPRVGYTVLGAQYVQSELSALDATGHIQSFLRDPSGLGQTINAERSVSFNAGFDANVGSSIAWQVNLYHNEVRELIDTQPVATKTNGQQVFTYFNRGSVFTRGVETQLSWRPIVDLRTTVSYTFLDARDRDVLDDLRAGRIYRRNETGRDERVPTSDYGGLSGRSRHAATLQLAYTLDGIGLTAATQARYRSRYGFGDVNGNGIVDTDAEYAPGYAVIGLTLTQSLFDKHEFAVGAQNLNGHRDTRHTPHLSGREFFAELHLSF